MNNEHCTSNIQIELDISDFFRLKHIVWKKKDFSLLQDHKHLMKLELNEEMFRNIPKASKYGKKITVLSLQF